MIDPSLRASLRIGMGRGSDGDTPRKRALDARVLGQVHGVLFGLARDGRRGPKSMFLFGCLRCGSIVRRRAIREDEARSCGTDCSAYWRPTHEDAKRIVRESDTRGQWRKKQLAARLGVHERTVYRWV